MDSPQKMDVGDWQDSPSPIIIRTLGVRRRLLPPALVGILGTLLLHAILIESISFGSRNPKFKPPETQQLASALSKSSESLTLISLPTVANASQAVSESAVSSLPNLREMKVSSPVTADPPKFLNLETLALSEEQASAEIPSGADGAELARLFGIYTGQIRARIDRVWRRPRRPVNEDKPSADPNESFQCEAQIVQDGRGNVREILLPRCNGSPAWRRSLVSAIQQASPLPAPPSVKVFTQSITLNFVGLSYTQGASNEEYEIAPLARLDH